MNSRRVASAAAPSALVKLSALALAVTAGLCLPLFLPTTSVAQEVAAPAAPAAPAAQIIRDIDVEYVGGATVAKERVLSNMSTKIGDELSPAKLDDDIASLYSSKIADNVKFFSEPMGGNSVRLIVQLQTRSSLGGVSVLGNSVVDTDKILDVADLSAGSILDEAAVQEARANIQELYRKRGYPEATVSYNITAPNAEGYSTVVFSVDEGGRGVLRKVEFVGNTVFSAGDLRGQMEQKEKSLWNIFSKKGRIDSDTIAGDVSRIEEHYRNHGYLNARVENASRVRVDDEKVDLVITISEGEQYTVGQVQVNGLRTISLDQVAPYLKLQAGNLYSGEYLTADIKLIQDLYGVQGFADARVSPNLSAAGANQVNVIYEVTEGQPFTLGRVNIDGNYKTVDKVIRREVLNKPGELYDTNKAEATRTRLMNMNYFDQVDMIATDTLTPGVKDMNITVSEKPTGTVNFGVGFSSIDDLVGFVDVTQSNFSLKNWPSMTGDGQRFRMSIKYGTERRDFIMSLTEPWFLNQRLALGGEVFYRDLFFLSDFYDQTNYGGAVSLRKPINDYVYVRGEYRAQMVEIAVARDASELFQQEQGDFFQSTFGVDLVFDNRDSVFLTRKGSRVSVGGDYSGLGGDVDTYGISLSGAHFVSLPFDTILSVNGGFDSVDGSGRVPIFEREFLGGANDLRGFRYRDVGPKDENDEPIGGNSALHATVEYTIPVITKVRLATFYDAGVVNRGSFDVGTSDYNSNYGIGVRLFILGGAPIRLDYGIPLAADEQNDSGGRFNFTLGYQF